MNLQQAGLRGLPDFSRAVSTSFGPVYGAYQREDFRVPPGGLIFARDEAGEILVRLRLVRGELPFMPPEPYSFLSLVVAAAYPSDDILNVLRIDFPAITLQEIRPEIGFMRLLPTVDAGTDEPFPAELSQAVSILRQGGEALRLGVNSSIENGAILEQMILQDSLAAQVLLEYELQGVAVRHAARLTFDSAQVLGELQSTSSGQVKITVDNLREFLLNQANSFVCRGLDEQLVELDNVLIDTILDRLIHRFMRFVPRDNPRGPAQVVLLETDVTGHIEWDLSLPTRVSRMFSLYSPVLNQLSIPLEQRVRRVQRIVVPSIRAGVRRVELFANLASLPAGLFMIGAHLSVPARPPQSLQAINQSVRFDNESLSATAMLPLAVLEPLQYYIQGFISIETNRGVVNLRGVLSEPQQDEIQVLTPDAFGASFIRLSISEALAQLATVDASLEFDHDQQRHRIDCALQVDALLKTLAIPIDAGTATLRLSFEDKSSTESLLVELPAVESMRFDLSSFSGYGPHTVNLHCPVPPGISFIEVECAPETQLQDPQARSKLVFFADTGGLSWHWFARSPFECGYRYRLKPEQEATFSAWSKPVRDLSEHWIDSARAGNETSADDSFSKPNQAILPET